MNEFVRKPPEERRLFFEQAAMRRNCPAFAVEKDFWVCWTLRALFSLPEWKDNLTFKGGTSLSKVWQLIDRFSEDIDLIVSRGFLGFAGETDPESAPTSSQEKKRLNRMARHYYDVYCMIRKGVADRAISDRQLLDRVVKQRMFYFNVSWVDYDTMRPGTIDLEAAKRDPKPWKKDYEAMREDFFFGDVPAFDEMLSVVGQFQNIFNDMK